MSIGGSGPPLAPVLTRAISIFSRYDILGWVTFPKF